MFQNLKFKDGAAVRKLYICDSCPKEFESPSKLDRHYLTHTGEKPFHCQDCTKSFRQLVHLERHKRTHIRPFQCNVCHLNFRKQETLSNHQKSHLKARMNKKDSSEKNGALAYCTRCSIIFANEENRLLHRCNFLNVTASKRHKISQCELCDKVFASRSKLERHWLIHTGQKPFTCTICGKCFRQKAHLKIHQQTHTQERPFQCTCCFKSFKTSGKLLKHKEDHIQQNYYPNILNRSRTTRATESVYNGIVQNVKEESHEFFSVYVIPYQCPTCDQCFETQDILDNHSCFILEDGKPLKRKPFIHNTVQSQNQEFGILYQDLQVCADSDSTAGNFFISGRKEPVNAGDTLHHFLGGAKGELSQRRMNKCDQCEKAFPSFSKLRRHYLIHTGLKPFTCSECGKNFRQSAHLKRHQVTHKKKMPFRRTKGKLSNLREILIQEETQAGCQYSQNQGYPSGILENLDGFEASLQYEVPEIKVEIEASCDSGSIQKFQPELHHKFRTSFLRERVAKARSKQQPQSKKPGMVHRSYKCSVCGKIFLSPSKLERHHLIHAGQKPFQCPDCGKTFRQNPHLKRHRLTHVRVKN
ncbi:hypothetical protein GDO86_016190 [Hymenochirus boettgeri]|uniref:C2H2-type domain-containing protein n=1 Tax=Hymenochirus boettgeri TaxID=247094 RepID=A0A8T2K1C2_9PIPI|nr:hypothetical protein GDO86_016190 [Hymenochirus boettgeri]